MNSNGVISIFVWACMVFNMDASEPPVLSDLAAQISDALKSLKDICELDLELTHDLWPTDLAVIRSKVFS